MADAAAVAVPEKKRRGRDLPGRRAGYGRAKGTPNKVTKLARDIARGLTLGNDKVVEKIRKKFEAGDIEPALFGKLLEYGYGKPKQTVEVEDSGSRLRPMEDLYESLSPDERRFWLEMSRRRRAMATVVELKALSDDG